MGYEWIDLDTQNFGKYPLITGWWLGQPSEKYEFVNWDDDFANMNGKIKNGNQTTNQIIMN